MPELPRTLRANSGRPLIGSAIVVVLSSLLAAWMGLATANVVLRRSYVDLPRQIGGPLMRFDQEAGYLPRPSVSIIEFVPATGRSSRLTTGDRGQRLTADARDRTSTRIRPILFVGDSFTWGAGVEAAEAYPAVVGGLLDRAVINAGVPGHGTLSTARGLGRFEGDRPSVVVYGWISEHERRNVSPCAPSATPFCISVPHYGFENSGAPTRHDVHDVDARELAASNTWWEWARRGPAVDPSLTGVRGAATELLSELPYFRRSTSQRRLRLAEAARIVETTSSEQRLSAQIAAIDELAIAVRGMGASLIVVNVDLGSPHASERFAALRGLAGDRSIRWIDVGGTGITPSLRIPNDGHPSTSGHRFIAGRIATSLGIASGDS